MIAKRRSSGEIAAANYRQKCNSVAEHTMPLVREIRGRIDKLAERVKTPVPPKDSRRDPEDDERKDDEIPIDVVELASDTLPEARPNVSRPTPKEKKA